MKQNKVEIKLHGSSFEGLKDTYQLAVKSVGEAIHAINILSRQKLYQTLLENDKKGIKYKLLVNGREYEPSESIQKLETQAIAISELVMKSNRLKTIDIIPVIEGADTNVFAIIAGVLLVVVGIVAIASGYGAFLGGALIMAGIGLIAAGVINLLSKPPQFEDFREISGGGKMSYLFNGPQNTTREGGPVPVGYGRLIVGSHVISASYELGHQTAKTQLTV